MNKIEQVMLHKNGSITIDKPKYICMYPDVTASSYRRIMLHCIKNMKATTSDNFPIVFSRKN